ncbi:MAG: LysM peptidoglycan-binding domain-containing protein [Okeania sp. SIO3B5]|uniref:LysM peptidoglycan-binding domain-containing protein n=1 Tax=Okeania sp. SIO3B5 TaxID=2607811 RepID=UPI0013FE8B94|nr:LysM peptidoglycan-binding domain-containing protein [Okeania sp. SIO3B5]NEO57284.1 LysM peptidoglycan-binding domain-containing protein [Okeania sp. SIO3B5]
MFMPDDINNLSDYTGVNSETTNTILPEIDINNPLIFTPSAESLSVPITQLNDLDNMILSQDSAIYEPTVDISTDSSVDTLTGEAIGQVINQAVIEGYQYLHEFAANPEFEAKMDLAFGDNWDKEANISLPPIQVISSAEINGANGAFAEATNTIYLSQEFLANNLGNIGEVTDVWLEEFGHYIDSQINIVDAVGDEGEIFSAVVQWKGLSEFDIEVLKSEDDRAFVEIDGKILEIENNYEWVSYTIQPGDSLSQIALNTTGDANRFWEIANYNGISNPNLIYVGQEILVPSNNSTVTNVEVATGNNDNWETYTVQPGDSLWAIAQRTIGDGNRYWDIADYNDIDNPSAIYVGQQILVPSNNSTGTTVVGVTTEGNFDNYVENDVYFTLTLPAYDGWSDNYSQRAEEGYNILPWWVYNGWKTYNEAQALAQAWDWQGQDDAAEFLRHYLSNTGTMFEFDLHEAERESEGVRQALEDGRNDVIEHAKNSVWNGETTGRIERGAQGYNLIPFGYGIDNWQLSLGKFDHFHDGEFWVEGNNIYVQITSTVKDVYDFEDFNPIGLLHGQGIAKNFPVVGTITETFVEPLNF